MDLDVKRIAPAISEGDLISFEANLRTRLPEDYRQFLLKYNGGRPEPSVFQVPSLGMSSHIQFLYAINGGDFVDLHYSMGVLAGRMPENLLPIGQDDCGNRIVLSRFGPDAGAIYFWDHEDEAQNGDMVGCHNVHKVADSFDQFMATLEPLSRIKDDGTGDVEGWIDSTFMEEQRRKGNVIE